MKFLLFVVLLLPAALQAQSADIIRRVEPLLNDPIWDHSTWGIAVKDLSNGKWIYRHNAEKLLMPASNTKIYTSAAALVRLGASYRYTTVLSVAGDDLILTGGGDPTLGGRFTKGDRTLVFRQWADSLKAAGVDTIRGRLLVDVSRYDDIRLGRGWSWDYTTYYWATQLSAMNYNDNCVDLIIVGGKPGEPATITWEPFNTDYVSVINKTMTIRKGERAETHYDRPWGTNEITVGNRIQEGDTVRYSVAVDHPGLYAMHVLRQVLWDAGIVALGDVAYVDEDVAEQESHRFEFQSPELREIIRVINKRSQNLYADALMKELSLSDSVSVGSHREGIAMAKHVYAAAGIDTTIMQMADGSGLTRINLFAPEMTIDLLTFMHAHPDTSIRNVFIDSLPFTGEQPTTLGAMFRGRNAPFVRAKTGTIGYARALSGYLTTTSGKTYAFSFMVNHYTESTTAANRVIESILTELAKD